MILVEAFNDTTIQIICEVLSETSLFPITPVPLSLCQRMLKEQHGGVKERCSFMTLQSLEGRVSTADSPAEHPAGDWAAFEPHLPPLPTRIPKESVFVKVVK